ncbi:MAG: FAD-binding domain-containing protein, partial [Leptospiraceae bacterium]|nr:FAD-binding domain-containing protein [Leptospiraceae bacterium]
MCIRDRDGRFILKWLPELKKLPLPHLHAPWRLTFLEQKFYHFELGRDYFHPIVNPDEHKSRLNEYIWKLKNEKEVEKLSNSIAKEFSSVLAKQVE